MGAEKSLSRPIVHPCLLRTAAHRGPAQPAHHPRNAAPKQAPNGESVRPFDCGRHRVHPFVDQDVIRVLELIRPSRSPAALTPQAAGQLLGQGVAGLVHVGCNDDAGLEGGGWGEWASRGVLSPFAPPRGPHSPVDIHTAHWTAQKRKGAAFERGGI